MLSRGVEKPCAARERSSHGGSEQEPRMEAAFSERAPLACGHTRPLFLQVPSRCLGPPSVLPRQPKQSCTWGSHQPETYLARKWRWWTPWAWVGATPAPESANLAANESAARFTRLGGRDQNFGGWHKIKPIMRCWLCSYHFILHGTPQSVLHPKFWFLATSPNFADTLGPWPTQGGGGGCGWSAVGKASRKQQASTSL